MSINSFKFMTHALADSLKNWPYVDTSNEPIPWTELAKPVTSARVALVSSGGFYCEGQEPFDLDHEIREPLWGDPSFREISRETDPATLRVSHLHYENSHAMKDMGCMFPMQTLEDMLAEGRIGDISPVHLSFMGFQPQAGTLVRESAPAMATRLRQAEVDLVLLSSG